VTYQEDDRTRGHRLCDSFQLRLVHVDRRIVVAAAREPIQRVDHLERKRRLCCRHFPQVAFGLLEHVPHGPVALLRNIRDQVSKVRIGENFTGQDARDFVARTTENALRALQCNERLVGGKLCKCIVFDGGLGLSLTQFLEVGTIADDAGEPLGPVLREPPPPGFAGFGDAAVKKVQQRTVVAPVRCGQPSDTQRLQPDSVVFFRQRCEPVVGAAPW
jgi:hypothetical protein